MLRLKSVKCLVSFNYEAKITVVCDVLSFSNIIMQHVAQLQKYNYFSFKRQKLSIIISFNLSIHKCFSVFVLFIFHIHSCLLVSLNISIKELVKAFTEVNFGL